MKLDRFINRPVLSTVISVVIVILGLLGLVSLPVTQYPDIAPPTVWVNTSYQGANAQAVLNSVIAPLEEQINGVENMMYMTSTATNTGDASIEVYFKQGTDPDMGAVNVQNRVLEGAGAVAFGSDSGRRDGREAADDVVVVSRSSAPTTVMISSPRELCQHQYHSRDQAYPPAWATRW